MNDQLVIAAIGEDRPGLVGSISGWVLDGGGNIVDSRMMVMGGEFAILLSVSGDPASLAKLEAQLGQTQDQLGMTLTIKRTGPNRVTENFLPYTVAVVALDHPGIVHNLANFFSCRNINIQDLSTTTYSAAHSGTPMFSVHMMLDMPPDSKIQALCQEFLEHCDRLNLDATIEPIEGER